jgi:hypothetical protein
VVRRSRSVKRVKIALDQALLVETTRLAGTVQLWEWIGDGATTFSY